LNIRAASIDGIAPIADDVECNTHDIKLIVMKQTPFTVLLTFLTALAYGQERDFDFNKVSFRGIEFSATKETIIKAFGQPKIAQTDYECGFFTNDQPGGPYYQLVYPDHNYIGSDKERFHLEHVHFDIQGDVKLQYGNRVLSGLSTKADIIEIFGDRAKTYFKENPGEDSILLLSESSDDGVVLTFKGNTLIEFQYWTPC
jgi:hypothetical protein